MSGNTTYYFLQPCLRRHIIFFPRSWQENRRDRFWHSSLSPYYVSPSSIYYLLIKFHSHWWCSSLQLLNATGPLHILPEIVPLFSTHGCYFFTCQFLDGSIISQLYYCSAFIDATMMEGYSTLFYLDHLIQATGEIIMMFLSRRAIWPQVTPSEPRNLCTEKWMWTWDSW